MDVVVGVGDAERRPCDGPRLDDVVDADPKPDGTFRTSDREPDGDRGREAEGEESLDAGSGEDDDNGRLPCDGQCSDDVFDSDHEPDGMLQPSERELDVFRIGFDVSRWLADG